MLEAELAHRDATKRARLLRQARLPVHKSAGVRAVRGPGAPRAGAVPCARLIFNLNATA